LGKREETAAVREFAAAGGSGATEDWQRAHLLEYLMRRFGDDVLSLAYFYLQDKQAAEDAAQEVFLRVYHNLEEFRGESSYFTWIYRITVNLCRDRLRSWHHRNIIPWDILWGHRTASPAAGGIEEQALDNVEAGEIMQAVLELPTKYREVVYLKYYSDMTVSEIARVCGINDSNVRVRLHRAYRMLKEKLARKGNWPHGRPQPGKKT